MLEFVNTLMYWISLLLNYNPAFMIIVAVLLLLGERRNSKRLKIAIVIVIAIAAGVTLKEVLQIPRPCVYETTMMDCPNDYAFPSLHATIAFALMIPFINKDNFAYYLLFALITVFSRIYLGVHSIEDIVGGLVVASITYYVVDKFDKKICPHCKERSDLQYKDKLYPKTEGNRWI